MKILEILNTEIQNRSYRGKFDNVDRTFKKMYGKTKDPRSIDSGNFSYVKKDNDPHMVVKTSRTPLDAEEDGYWVYIDYIIKHKLWENTYFPRVYINKNIKDSDNNSMRRIKMEKLFKFSSINSKELLFLENKVFGSALEIDPDDSNDKGSHLFEFAKQVSKDIYNGVSSSEKKDSNYIEAVTIIGNIMKNKNLALDLHDDNLMIRRSNSGVQLVITDPFSFKKT